VRGFNIRNLQIYDLIYDSLLVIITKCGLHELGGNLIHSDSISLDHMFQLGSGGHLVH